MEQQVKLDQIDDYINQLKNKKQDAQNKGDLKQMQSCVQKLEELNAIKIIYNNIHKVEENEIEVLGLDIQNKQQLEEFDQAWDDLYKLEQDRIEDAEQTLYELHSKEQEQLQKHLDLQEIPKIKYSAEIIKKQNHYHQLIKTQQYGQAEMMRKELEEQMGQEKEKWIRKYNDKQGNKLNQLTKKQINELSALKQKLNGQLEQFLINKEQQKQLLLQKQQIAKNDLEAKNHAECTKFNQQNNKLLLKLQHLF